MQQESTSTTTENTTRQATTPNPTIGRIVWYQKYGTPGGEHKAEPSPAVVTRVNDDNTCDLFVMNPNGCYFNRTPYSETLKGGHWSWPQRDDGASMTSRN
jgi:hypothetical protein